MVCSQFCWVRGSSQPAPKASCLETGIWMTAWTVACLVISDAGRCNTSRAKRQGGKQSKTPASPAFHGSVDYTRARHDSARPTSGFDSTILSLCRYGGESQVFGCKCKSLKVLLRAPLFPGKMWIFVTAYSSCVSVIPCKPSAWPLPLSKNRTVVDSYQVGNGSGYVDII